MMIFYRSSQLVD